MADPNDPQLPFEQAYHSDGPLTIGFESARVTCGGCEVDLVNTGINQILSVAAVRGHRLLHFSMADLHGREGEYAAEAAILELDPAWDGADPHHAHRHLCPPLGITMILSGLTMPARTETGPRRIGTRKPRLTTRRPRPMTTAPRLGTAVRRPASEPPLELRWEQRPTVQKPCATGGEGPATG